VQRRNLLTDTEWTELRKYVMYFLKGRGRLSSKLRDDATQETLLRLFKALSRGADIRDPYTWCRATAWHLILRWLPDEQRHDPELTMDERKRVAVALAKHNEDPRTPERDLMARQEIARVDPKVIDLLERRNAGELLSGTERRAISRERQRLKEEDKRMARTFPRGKVW
jgi:DNA-directed RNA polymerase specialized sigma24 family protein